MRRWTPLRRAGILTAMVPSMILGCAAVVAGLVLVVVQARGRDESVALWAFIYLAVVGPSALIPFPAITLVIVIGSLSAIPVLMKPWARKSVTFVAPSHVDKAEVLEIAKQSGYLDGNTDVRLHFADVVPDDAVALKVYQHVAQQSELNADAAALRGHGIVPYLRFGPITTLSVHAKDVEMAALLLKLEVGKTYDPSEN